AVDGSVRLAEIEGLAAEFAIELRKRARAIDVAVTALDHDVGIGADERQAARGQVAELLAVVFRTLDLVVEGAGDENELGVLFLDAGNARVLEKRQIALRADVIAARAEF